jgi:hypothetical protein
VRKAEQAQEEGNLDIQQVTTKLLETAQKLKEEPAPGQE